MASNAHPKPDTFPAASTTIPGFRFHIGGKWSDTVTFGMTVHPPDSEDTGWAEIEDAAEDVIRDFRHALGKKNLEILNYWIDPKSETITGTIVSRQ